MRILSNLSKLGAIVALSTSVVTFPAVAQHSGSGFKVQKVSKFQGRRGGSFRGSRGFRGNNFRGSRGFRGNSFKGSRSFRGNNFRRSTGFRGNSFRGSSGFKSSGFRGSSFNRGFRGNGFKRGFRGNSFNRGFRSRSFNRGIGFNSGFKRTIVHVPIYSVGGFYGVHSNSIFISDFAAHGLYAPPRGYHWVCDKGSNDAVLAAVATGAIIAVAAGALVTPY